jgi:hypothetical protein
LVIQLQNFDGSWEQGDDLLTTVGVPGKGLKEAVDDSKIQATIAVLCWLDIKHADTKEEWYLLSKKAMGWLSRQELKGYSVDQLKDLHNQE